MGRKSIFELRKKFSDFMLINTYVDRDFVDMHDLFVTGKRYNPQTNRLEYYVKSRKAEDYKQMLLDSLIHPPFIEVDLKKTNDERIYLVHKFEGKQLFKDYIPDTMLGIEYLWGAKVELETTEIVMTKPTSDGEKPKKELRRLLYTMSERKISKRNL